MALGIYKPGEGYWVRVMTAGLIGVIAVSAAAWLWNQAAIVADKLPKAGWTLDVKVVPADAKPGSTLTLYGAAADPALPQINIGSATISEVVGNSIKVKPPTLIEKKDPTAITSFVPGPAPMPGSEPTFTKVDRRSPIATIEPTLFSGLAAAAALLVGSVVGYWLVAVRPKTVEFLIATDFEMKRVNWSTPREIIGSTYVVIAACVLVTLSLFIFDRVFENVFKLVGILPQ